jgi:ankyrin repeat protein
MKTSQFVNKRNGAGCAAIHIALENNQLALTEQLMSYRARLDLGNGQGNTALHLAAITGNSNLIKNMIGHCR